MSSVETTSQAPIGRALAKAYTNLIDWHEYLAEPDRGMFTSGGELTVRTNGHTTSYDVSVEKVNPRKKYAGHLGEPTDSVLFHTKDPKRGNQPREVELHYRAGMAGQADGLREARAVWDIKDGLVGESIICSNGKIDHILKSGINHIYQDNEDLVGLRVDWEGEGYEVRRMTSQIMALQFRYDERDSLTHHYARLGNWDETLFWYVDGEPRGCKISLPDFPYEFFTVRSLNVNRDGTDSRGYTSSTHRMPVGDMSKYAKTREDGQGFIYEILGIRGRDGKSEYQVNLETPLILDVLPHIQNAFPASVGGVIPLLSGSYSRMLRLQIEAPTSSVQKILAKDLRNLSRTAWVGVTTEQIREAYQFFIEGDIIPDILRDVNDIYGMQDRIYEVIPRVVTMGYKEEAVRVVVRKLAESGTLRALTDVHLGLREGLSEEYLKWALSVILQGQSDLINKQTQKNARSEEIRDNISTVVHRLHCWRRRHF